MYGPMHKYHCGVYPVIVGVTRHPETIQPVIELNALATASFFGIY
jgi:hypothetical protein